MARKILFIVAAMLATTPVFSLSREGSEVSIKVLQFSLKASEEMAKAFQHSIHTLRADSELSLQGVAYGSDVVTMVLTDTSAFSQDASAFSREYSEASEARGGSDASEKSQARSEKESELSKEASQESSEKGSELSKEASQASREKGSSVITSSGKVIDASIDRSKNLIHVIADNSGKVFSWSSQQVIGSFEVSREGIVFFMNASGQVIDDSGKALGTVVDSSGETVKFVTDSGGQILDAASHDFSLAITVSTQILGEVAKFSGETLKAIILGVSDVSLVVITTAVAASNYAVRGEFPKASEVLLYLPSNMLYGAMYSDMHYQKMINNFSSED